LLLLLLLLWYRLEDGLLLLLLLYGCKVHPLREQRRQIVMLGLIHCACLFPCYVRAKGADATLEITSQ